MNRHNRLAIDELHRRDMAASRAGDFDALRALLDDEAVMLPPGERPQRADELDAAFAKMKQAPRTHEVLEYVLDFEEVRVVGEFAIEWGTIRGTTRDLATGKATQSLYHVMRILRKQSHGAWKVYRSIWSPAGP